MRPQPSTLHPILLSTPCNHAPTFLCLRITRACIPRFISLLLSSACRHSARISLRSSASFPSSLLSLSFPLLLSFFFPLLRLRRDMPTAVISLFLMFVLHQSILHYPFEFAYTIRCVLFTISTSSNFTSAWPAPISAWPGLRMRSRSCAAASHEKSSSSSCRSSRTDRELDLK